MTHPKAREEEMKALWTAMWVGVTASGCIITTEGGAHTGYGYGYGDLQVRATFDGADCWDAGVDWTDITIVGRYQGYAESQSVSCSINTDAVTFYDIPDDTYDVYITGERGDGLRLYDNHGATTLTIVDGAFQSFLVDVPAVRSSVTIEWSFYGSFVCADVYDVRVTLVDPQGFTYDDAMYDCGPGGVTYDAIQTGTRYATLRAYAYDGTFLYDATNIPVVLDQGLSQTYVIDLQ